MMKVITLKQPWATLIALGYKQYEFRSWSTKYRGPILIHAGQGVDKIAMHQFQELNLEYPKSQIVAKCLLTDCLLLDSELNKKIIQENPFIYGHHLNRVGYAWKLAQIEPVHLNKMVKGKLSIWEYNLTKSEKNDIII